LSASASTSLASSDKEPRIVSVFTPWSAADPSLGNRQVTYKLFEQSTDVPADVAFVFLTDIFELDDYLYPNTTTFIAKNVAPRYNSSRYYIPTRLHVNLGVPDVLPIRASLTFENDLNDLHEILSSTQGLKPPARVVLVGAGYAGALAAAYKAHFNDTKGPRVVAAIADTPHVQYDDKDPQKLFSSRRLDFDRACADTLEGVTAILAEKLTTDEGQAELVQHLRLCGPVRVQTQTEKAFFWLTIMMPILRAIDHGVDNVKGGRRSAEGFCKLLTTQISGDTPFERFGRYYDNLLESTRGCVEADFKKFMVVRSLIN